MPLQAIYTQFYGTYYTLSITTALVSKKKNRSSAVLLVCRLSGVTLVLIAAIKQRNNRIKLVHS